MKILTDIYFNKDYGILYEKIENGKCQSFEFQNELGSVRHLFIKREIPIQLGGETYYDLITPYGYGGPVMQPAEGADKKELAQAFVRDFEQHCKRENIVSEFVRFHPVLRNAVDFGEFYDTVFMRNTIQTRLAATADPLMSEYSPSIRRYIRKALKQGVEYRVYMNPDNLDKFQELYLQTMDRNKADDYYYFDEEYFSQCVNLLGPQLVMVEVTWKEKVIAMSLNFASNGVLHIHLTGSLENYHDLYAPNILQYALLRWGMENNIELIHHGGGRTNEPDDKLYLYKKKYGRVQELEFHVGKKIWNKEIYELLCKETNMEKEPSFFPAYRKNLRVREEIK
ncbi:GNAT family N-acetyltransferase [Planococcus halotolerans]|uniref:GNAT family N-acetyltransferase n=1 Tax=Planococcus halotolerans TaxID=2233542 RepID=UPI001F249CF4|nr:GNAT family N-acetyltransferase [Planococcus halotolerans]